VALFQCDSHYAMISHNDAVLSLVNAAMAFTAAPHGAGDDDLADDDIAGLLAELD
jgi:hypothetical protein